MVGAYGLGEVLVRMEKGFVTPAMEPGRKVGTRPAALERDPQAQGHASAAARSSGSSAGSFRVRARPSARSSPTASEAQYGARRDKLGTGIAEGIVAPQLASTATVGGHMVPLLALGIPGSGATAVILGAFLLHGVQPGPQIFQTSGDMVYTIFASMFAAVLGMCLLGYFAIKPLIKVLYLPEAVTSAFVVLFCFVGRLQRAQQHHRPVDDRDLRHRGLPVRALPVPDRAHGAGVHPRARGREVLHDEHDRYKNDWTVFFTRPISGIVMALTILALAYPMIRHVRRVIRAKKLPPGLAGLGGGARP